MAAILYALPFLASSSKVKWPKADDPLLLAAVALTVLWALLLLAFAYSTRSPDVDAAPPTMDLGPEPPAIVNLLVNHARVTTNGVQATLLDLAARNFIDIEEYGAGQQIVCRIKEPMPSTPLESYAQIVYDHVRREAVNGAVVAQALTTGAKGAAGTWWSGFQKLVQQDAQARGFTQDRWSKPMWSSQRLVGFAAGGMLVLVGARAGLFEATLILVLIVALSLHGALIAIFGEHILNENGRTSASHWLGVRRYLEENGGFDDDTPGAVEIWERYLAYAAAMGLANKAIRALPMGAEDDEKAWSAYGGDWREVRVAYPRFRIIWGRSPLGAMFTAIIIGALGGGLIWLSLQVRDSLDTYAASAETIHWIRIGTIIAVGVGALVLVWGVRTLVLSVTGLTTRLDVQGEIIRRRAFTSDKKVTYFLALDDGKAARVRAWRVQSGTYHQWSEGSVVKAHITPRLGYVFKMEGVSQTSPASAR